VALETLADDQGSPPRTRPDRVQLSRPRAG